MLLDLDDDELSSCVACGLCLPHCPTYRATGEEALSPRGRIDAMRAVQWREASPDEEFVHFIETCVQCRGCEPACPSGVPFGRLMERTRATLASQGRITPWWQRAGYRVLGRHRLLLAGSTMLAVAQRLRLVPARLGLPRVPVRRGRPLTPTGSDVWLFTGCVMDAWLRSTHRSTAAVLDAMGTTYSLPGSGGACCGALQVHAGLHHQAGSLARRVIESMPGSAPVVVNSAGCGAALKDYGDLVGTDEARVFASRVVDVHEWVHAHLDLLPAPRRRLGPVIVQDPCHLRHVQRTHGAVRQVLEHVAEVVELDDDGLCCGAGGAYSALEPELAGMIRAQKVEAINRAVVRSGATRIASANPGCAMHLAGAMSDMGLRVEHPLDLVAEALQ
jgi:glycolate oxidase iron-sulfur subunit